MRVLFLICSFLVVMSCSEDDEDNNLSCPEATLNTATALSNFTNTATEDYEEFCNAYKSALEEQKEACGDSSGAIQTIIDGLGDCEDNISIDD